MVSMKEFCPTRVFNYLDVRNVGSVNSQDVKQFLEKNTVFVTTNEADLLFNSLDLAQTGEIKWVGFLDVIVGKEHFYDDQVEKNEQISRELQETLVRIFMNELEGLKMVEKYKHNVLNLESDEHNLDNLFEELDTISKGFMDVRDIYDFLKVYSS
jgi:Ca2+-binding EF-hand superfamily protein